MDTQSGARDRRVVKAVIFDGDDTLWRTEPLYDDARDRARTIVASTGLDGANWERVERELDVLNVATMGYSKERFPLSCVQAYELVCQQGSRLADPEVSAAIRQVASLVFENCPPLMPYVQETLGHLRQKGIKIALLTKGDRQVQKKRIACTGLVQMFDVVRIVDEKSPLQISAVLKALAVPPESALMVGNSVRSDILPALAAGLRAAWLNSHVWEYERMRDHELPSDHRVTTISAITEVEDVVQ